MEHGPCCTLSVCYDLKMNNFLVGQHFFKSSICMLKLLDISHIFFLRKKESQNCLRQLSGDFYQCTQNSQIR